MSEEMGDLRIRVPSLEFKQRVDLAGSPAQLLLFIETEERHEERVLLEVDRDGNISALMFANELGRFAELVRRWAGRGAEVKDRGFV
jgi:hypothetical protein